MTKQVNLVMCCQTQSRKVCHHKSDHSQIDVKVMIFNQNLITKTLFIKDQQAVNIKNQSKTQA